MTKTTYDFDSGEYGCDLDFTDGVITFGAYSYQIDSYGGGELSKEETRKLYEAMKAYYGDSQSEIDALRKECEQLRADLYKALDYIHEGEDND